MLLKGNDVNIITLEDKLSFDYTFGSGSDKGSEVKHIQSSIHSGTLLSIIAENDINLEAVSLESLDTYLYAKNDVNILTVTDIKGLTKKRETNSFFSKTKTTDEIKNTSILRTDIKTKNLTIIGKNSVTLDSVTGSVKTMDVDTLELKLLSQKETSYSNHSGNDEGIFTKTVSTKGFIEEKLIETDIKISDKMTLNSKDITDSLKSIDNTKVLLSEYNLKNKNITQIKTGLISKTWNESTTTLTTVGSLVLGATVSFLTAGVMSSSFMAGLLPSASTTLSTVSTSIARSLISSSLNSIGSSIITGEKFNLDIKETLKGALSSGFIAGVTPGIYDAVGLPDNTQLTNLDFTQKISKNVTDSIVNSSINSLVYNTNFADNLKINIKNGIVDIGYSYVGDIAQKYEYKDGSFQKTALHSLWGGVGAEITGGDFVDGATSAAVREIVSPLTAKTDKEDKKEDLQLFVSQLAGITTGKITGGDEGAVTGNAIASSAEINNRQLHEDEILWLEENAQKFADENGISIEKAKYLLTSTAKYLNDKDKQSTSLILDLYKFELAKDFLLNKSDGMSFRINSDDNPIGVQQRYFISTVNQFNNSDFDPNIPIGGLYDNSLDFLFIGGGKKVIINKLDNVLITKNGKKQLFLEYKPNKVNPSVPEKVIRQDNNFNSMVNDKGNPKAYINDNGDLVPVNLEGTNSIQTQIRGGKPADSQYISTTDVSTTRVKPKSYGKDVIKINTRKLQEDIDKGILKDIEIITPKKIQEELQTKIDKAEERYNNNPTNNNTKKLTKAQTDLKNTQRDNECLIKGCVPKDYIKETTHKEEGIK